MVLIQHTYIIHNEMLCKSAIVLFFLELLKCEVQEWQRFLASQTQRNKKLMESTKEKMRCEVCSSMFDIHGRTE